MRGITFSCWRRGFLVVISGNNILGVMTPVEAMRGISAKEVLSSKGSIDIIVTSGEENLKEWMFSSHP